AGAHAAAQPGADPGARSGPADAVTTSRPGHRPGGSTHCGSFTTVTKKSSICWTTVMNRSKSTGLVTYALACRSYERSTSSSASDVVSTTTGIARNDSSALISASTSRP